MDPLKVLHLSKSQCRAAFPTPEGASYDKIVVGAIITQTQQGQKPKILLLKRAAHETCLPNVYEIPGGKMDDTDETVFDAVKREVMEETALDVNNITGAVRTFSYTMEKVVKDDATAEDKVISVSSIQFNFICETSSEDFRVNPEEHSEGMFASLEEMEAVNCTDEMRQTVRAAFHKIANE